MRLKARHAALAVGLLSPLAVYLWEQGNQPQAAPKPAPAAPAPKRQPAKPAAKPPAAPAAAPKTSAEPPKRLAKPPEIVKGVYFTGWSAGLRRRIDYLIDLRKTTALNTLVFDIKDYSGFLAYRVAVPEAQQYKAVRVMIRDLDGLVNRLHQEGIYVIARITVFQDPVLARARPDLAVHRVSKLAPPKAQPKPEASARPAARPKIAPASLAADTLWLDRKGLAWIDPASKAAWEYIAAIGRDALSHGIDELNFDYVRFPSDGDLKDMYFPHWDGRTPKHLVIRAFFSYLRKQFPEVPISADLFGLATVNEDDLGIGQVIEDAYSDFDAVCPMVYPSHFARHFLGFPNPAEHPYEVVNYSIGRAGERLEDFLEPVETASTAGHDGDPPASADGNGKPKPPVKLRPWLQDFNLGARYSSDMVKAEIKAVEDALGERFAGYFLWSSSNVYTREALK